MAPDSIVLDDSNSRVYRTRRVEKHAVLIWKPATYPLAWGTQNFEGPHMLVDNEYGVDLRVFFTTHEPIAEREHHYVKVAKVRALQVTKDTEISTLVRGREEMKSMIRKGGWIIQNPDGELYYNSEEEFARQYILSEDAES